MTTRDEARKKLDGVIHGNEVIFYKSTVITTKIMKDLVIPLGSIDPNAYMPAPSLETTVSQ